MAIRALIAAVWRRLDVEGFLLLAGTILLAIGSSYLSPAGPYFVVGAICVVAALGLAVVPERKA